LQFSPLFLVEQLLLQKIILLKHQMLIKVVKVLFKYQIKSDKDLAVFQIFFIRNFEMRLNKFIEKVKSTKNQVKTKTG